MWRVLFVYMTSHPRAVRLTIRQHLDALERLPSAWVLPYNAVNGMPSWLGRLDFDAVVLDTTTLCMRWTPGYEDWRKRSDWIAELDALKIALPQDEYHHSATLDDWLDDVGVTVIGTVLGDRHRDELYPRMSKKAAFYKLLTGYIDEDAAERLRPRLQPLSRRELDIVYRARNLPYWLGSHGQLKHRIGEAVAERAPAHGLRTDISTRQAQTVLGDAWLDFMASGRATIGAESGSSTLDRRGELSIHLDELLTGNPELTFEEYARQMPPGWDDYEFFAISPRHLEAVVTKTAQILVEGSYSGVLEAHRHYVPVRRDLSDLDEALEAARDDALLERLAEQAYADIYESGRYGFGRLTETVEEMLSAHARPGRGRGPAPFRPLVETAAAAEGWAERVLANPVASFMRVRHDATRELLGGLRLFAGNRRARRLIVDYLLSTETRNHVAPRKALWDLMALGALQRAAAGRFDGLSPFEVSVEVDEGRKRFLIRSRSESNADGRELPLMDELAAMLEQPGWEFYVDHSEVGPALAYPLFGSRSVEIPLRAGPSSLPVLSWLARYRPRHVAAALSPVLRRR